MNPNESKGSMVPSTSTLYIKIKQLSNLKAMLPEYE